MPERILFVNVPSDGSFPIGPVALASHVIRRVPRTVQFLLDLSLLPAGQRRQALDRTVADFRPSVVAFSWRDVQDFAPEYRDPRFRVLLKALYPPGRLAPISPRLLLARRRFEGAHEGRIRANLSMVQEFNASSPGTRVVLGGAAPSLFGPWLRRRLPPDLAIVPGDGEVPLEALARGEDLTATLGRGSVGRPPALHGWPFLGGGTRQDPGYIAEILPTHRAYLSRPLPIQTKRGCPHRCALGVCPVLEGRELRLRDPAEVAAEIGAYRDTWGARAFRLVDSHLFGDGPSVAHGAAVLDAILREGGGIRWTGLLSLGHLDVDIARLLVRTGLGDFDLAVGTGPRGSAHGAEPGADPGATLAGLARLVGAGFRGRIHVGLVLNVPCETDDTLKETAAWVKEAAAIAGEARLTTGIALAWIQPGTGLERRLLAEGYLPADYDPLRLDLPSARLLLHNPGRLGRRIALDLAEAWEQGFRDEAGGVVLDRLEGGAGQD